MPTKKIAVIGAGASGLITLRQFAFDQNDKYEIICFEQLSDVGGLWIYSDVIRDVNHPTGSDYTAVYKNLLTNTPIQIMALTDFPFPSGLPSFVKHEVVKEYLQDYCHHFNLKRFIQSDKYKPMPLVGHDYIWIVKVEDVNTKVTTTYSFDVIIVCNGHYSKPVYPKIKGIDKFKGTLLHSLTYRDPKDYENKKVLIIGGSSSGVDIAPEISEFAKKIWISHRNSEPLTIPSKIEQIGEISHFDNASANYRNGRKPNVYIGKSKEFVSDDKLSPESDDESYQSSLKSIDNIDYVICCTGYAYSFPFLSCDCGVAVTGPFHVGPLYKDLISISRPTLAFIGLHSMVSSFPLMESQAKFYKAFLDGRVDFPKSSRDAMEILKQDMELKKEQNINVFENPYKIIQWQWEYSKDLAKLGGFDPLPDYYQTLSDVVLQQRKMALWTYKQQKL